LKAFEGVEPDYSEPNFDDFAFEEKPINECPHCIPQQNIAPLEEF